MKLNDFFDSTFCINLRRRQDRHDESVAEFKKHNLFIQFIEGVDGKEMEFVPTKSSDGLWMSGGDFGCVASHLKIVKLAKKHNLKNYFVFEDDCELSNNFNEEFEKCIEQLPKDWGFVYLGGNPQFALNKVSENIYKCNQIFTTHAFGVSNFVYDEMIRGWQMMEDKIDVTLSKLHAKYPTYIVKPYLVMQRASHSDILDRYQEDWTLEKRR